MTISWHHRVLAPFVPGLARLILTADPDGVLLGEEIAQSLRERGFELLIYDDPIAFRYTFETRVRSQWDQGAALDVVVVVRAEESALDELPFDLLEADHKVALGLNNLFPQLSYPVVACLDADDLATLWQAVAQFAPAELGNAATMDFVLRHVHGIAPELVKQPADLLRMLLRRHYSQQRIPRMLENHLIARLRLNSLLRDWPLDDIVTDREAFLAFLQERWPRFLNRLANEEVVAMEELRLEHEYGRRLPGPSDLPFGHEDVRIYIDNLFLEGYLQPVAVRNAKRIASTWASVGARIDPVADRRRRLARLVDKVAASIPSAEAKHSDWLAFAHRWAELTALVLAGGNPQTSSEIDQWRGLHAAIDGAFASWLHERYMTLHSLPPVPPVMVHHLPRAMLRHLEETPDSRVALVVLDGLALNQWHVIRAGLREQKPDLELRESALFAWIPTLTQISRQAIFAGKSPYYFGDTIYRIDKEPDLWSRFWVDAGFDKNTVGLRKGNDVADLGQLADWLSQPHLQIVGLVVDKVDDIVHGMKLGMAGMHNQVHQWAGGGYLAGLISLLQEGGFTIWLTADHGNVEARGVGQPKEGVIADVRGARVRLFPTASLRSQVHQKFPDAVEWKPMGLPEGVYPLLAGGRTAFVTSGQQVVTHGGASIEEVIVPFVEIARPPV